jgi:hypothetical protein
VQHGGKVLMVKKMAKRLKTERNRTALPATVSGINPGNFKIGSRESRAAARALLDDQATRQREMEATELANLTPFEEAISEGESGLARSIMIGFARIAEVRAEVFGFSLPTPEEIRYLRDISRVADEIAGGKFAEICRSGDGAEEKRLRRLAADQLRREGRVPPASREKDADEDGSHGRFFR